MNDNDDFSLKNAVYIVTRKILRKFFAKEYNSNLFFEFATFCNTDVFIIPALWDELTSHLPSGKDSEEFQYLNNILNDGGLYIGMGFGDEIKDNIFLACVLSLQKRRKTIFIIKDSDEKIDIEEHKDVKEKITEIGEEEPYEFIIMNLDSMADIIKIQKDFMKMVK